MMRLASVAGWGALAMIALVFAPWGQLSISILDTPVPLDFKGSQIGSDIGSVPWGWFLIAAGIVILFALGRGSATGATAGSIAAMLFTLVNLATLGQGTPHIAVQGADTVLKPTVAAAWGSYAEVVAALVVVAAVLLLRRASYWDAGASDPNATR